MAESKKKRTRKAPAPKKEVKKESMRTQAAKSREAAKKPKRVRKAASAVTKPVSKTASFLTTEFHLFDRKDGGNFFTKSRSLVPKFFREAWAELKLVTWPGRKETWRLVFAVFVFAIAMGVTIALLDYALENLLRKVIL